MTAAHDLARSLVGGMADRRRHTAAVAARAGEPAVTVPPDDRDVLVSAAWLHDIGYAPEIADTGFHPLDGALHLERLGWPRRVCALVAHHSGARLVADVHGLGGRLDRFPHEDDAVSDALTHADQTTDSRGHRVTVPDRLADMLARHGPDSPNARVHHLRGPLLPATGDRVERRLAAVAAGTVPP
ncbi:HD domain-containing protein [Saccharothrix sp. Mg75]|uniref:HD domain-containing protein n=1 Tax=Saccharothrix sp. Mg75 TaxID=3445357 RepID=UPI003EEEA48A